jgi:hypothetical protein
MSEVALVVFYSSSSFQKIGLGDLLVIYDEEVFGARIQMETCDGEIVCNHHIAMETQLSP